MAGQYEKMLEFNRKNSLKKLEYVKEVVGQMKKDGDIITLKAVSLRAGVCRNFIYAHKELYELINKKRAEQPEVNNYKSIIKANENVIHDYKKIVKQQEEKIKELEQVILGLEKRNKELEKKYDEATMEGYSIFD